MNYLQLTVENISDNEIEIAFSGYIDSDTANEFGDFVSKLHDENPHHKLILDFKKVKMITSACIRWLLTFEKRGYNFELANVSKEVFTVLKLTGVSALLDINTKTLSICTNGCKVLGKGYSSEVFRIDDEIIAKIYYNIDDIDTAIRERMIAKEAFVKGVPTEISFGLCESNGMPGLVYELVKADTLLSLLVEDENNIDKYIKEYVELVKKLQEFDNEGMYGIYDKKADYIEDANFIKQYIPQRCYEAIIKLKDEIPDSKQLLHGDPHPANVMLTDKGMIFIDLSDMGFGDEKFDLMFLYRTLKLFSLLPNDSYPLKREQSNKLWDAFIKEFYKDKDDDYVQNELRIIKLLALNSIIRRFCGKDPNSFESKFFINELIKTVDSE